ncbi:MAG: hypothetical protein IJM56_06750 [Clostridia bacterium]|nr:hypothetical protein [Clostridia bacterium]
MKKLVLFLLTLSLILGLTAGAEYDTDIWEIFDAGESFTADFDNDENDETMRFSCALNEYDDGDFTLSVGETSVTKKDCVGLEPKVYAMKAGYTWYYYGTVFMVNEYGPSDDPLTYCFLYTEGELIDLGMIPALVDSFKVGSDGVISTKIRAAAVGTWYRPADYVLAVGSEEDANGEWRQIYSLCEVPRPFYPMNMLVTLKRDITLSSSLYDMDEDVSLSAGTKVALLASDETSRLFVSDLTGQHRGWLAMRSIDWTDYIRLGDEYVEIDEVFDGILYAD